MTKALRKGVIVVPKKGRLRSNDFGIGKIKKLKIVDVRIGWGAKGQHRYQCVIQEGTSTRYGTVFGKGDSIKIYSDAVEEETKTVLYEIY